MPPLCVAGQTRRYNGAQNRGIASLALISVDTFQGTPVLLHFDLKNCSRGVRLGYFETSPPTMPGSGRALRAVASLVMCG